MPNVTRKLATILAADCVSFSYHMEHNEEITLVNLKSCRDLIDSTIESHGGRIFHTAGDSVVAEFSSSVECVHAAIEMQEILSQRNEKLSSDDQLEWRIGIHLDDVIIEGDNIYGTGVNIAARLEAECKPGSILLSRSVSEQVKKRIKFDLKSEGMKNLKNISEPIEIYSLTHSEKNIITTSNDKTVDASNLPSPGIPKIALLPFDNLNQNEESGHLVDGIVEDLITELSMIKEIEILSRQSSFDFRNNDSQLEDFSKQHNLDFIITGSIRTSGKRVRLTIQILDSNENNVLWSNRYDRIMEDVFDLQDEIVRKISISLVGEIELASLNRSKRKPTNNFTSYEYLLRGKEMHHKFDINSNKIALNMFDKAIIHDPKNAQAYAWKACTLGQAIYRNYSEMDDDILIEEAYNLIDKAIALNENDVECHRMLAEIYLSGHEYTKAEYHGSIAYNMLPNDPRVLSVYGSILSRVNKNIRGIELLQKALELDPIPQGQINSDKRISDIYFAHFLDNNYQICLSLINDISHLDLRSEVVYYFCKNELMELDDKSEEFFQFNENLKKIDWRLEINRFHIPQEKVEENLINFYAKYII